MKQKVLEKQNLLLTLQLRRKELKLLTINEALQILGFKEHKFQEPKKEEEETGEDEEEEEDFIDPYSSNNKI